MKRDEQRGVAVVLALAVITLLCSLVVDFSYTMMVDLTLASNVRDQQQAYLNARSGVELVRHLLVDDDPDYDGLDEAWALMGEHPGRLADDDQGSFAVAVEDEAGKININKLVSGGRVDPVIRSQILRLCEVLAVDPKVIDAIIDWLDPDDEPQPFGAEQEYYLSLPSPYPCKNAPLDTLEELLLIKGINEEILYGNAEKRGLIHYLTLYTEGKVNINTAPIEVIQSLSDDIDVNLARAIIELREKKGLHELDYDDIKQLPGMSIGIFEEIRDQCDVKSSFFSLRAQGEVRGIKRVIYTVFKRDDEGVKPIFWRVD